MTDILNGAYEQLKKFSKQIHVPLYDLLLAIDIIFLSTKHSQSILSINKNTVIELYYTIYKPSIVLAIFMLCIPIIIISIRSKSSDFFFVRNDSDGQSRGYVREVGAGRYLKIIHLYFHQLWILVFSLLVMAGAFTFSNIFSSYLTLFLFLCNSSESLFLIGVSLFYVEYQELYPGKEIKISNYETYTLMTESKNKNLKIIKSDDLNNPIYYLVQINPTRPDKGIIVMCSKNYFEVKEGFNNNAILIKDMFTPVVSSHVPKSVLEDSSRYSMNQDEK